MRLFVQTAFRAIFSADSVHELICELLGLTPFLVLFYLSTMVCACHSRPYDTVFYESLSFTRCLFVACAISLHFSVMVFSNFALIKAITTAHGVVFLQQETEPTYVCKVFVHKNPHKYTTININYAELSQLTLYSVS